MAAPVAAGLLKRCLDATEVYLLFEWRFVQCLVRMGAQIAACMRVPTEGWVGFQQSPTGSDRALVWAPLNIKKGIPCITAPGGAPA